jgi:hypothetical protein
VTTGGCSGIRRENVAGSSTSQCPVHYEIKIRIMTLNPSGEPEGRRIGQRWDYAVRLQESVARTVFERHCIHVRETERTDCPVELSRELLTRNIRDEAAADPPGGTYEQRLESAQRMAALSYQALARSGNPNPRAAESHYALRVAEAPTASPSVASSTASTPTSPVYVASDETLNLLRYNRQRGEISVYFVPAIDGYYGSVTGQALTSQYWSNVSDSREGIVINSGARYDTLSHELGHLLMRIGHFSLQGPEGRTEGSAPRDNLMHGSGEDRVGMNLNEQQAQEIFNQGRSHGYVQVRGRR